MEVREEMKEKWITFFDSEADFASRQEAVDRLTHRPELAHQQDKVSELVAGRGIEDRFDRVLGLLSGGTEPIEFGYGLWLERLRGKKVLPAVVAQCFRVPDRNGRILQGPVAVFEVGKELVRKPITDQPDDFQQLQRLIQARLRSV